MPAIYFLYFLPRRNLTLFLTSAFINEEYLAIGRWQVVGTVKCYLVHTTFINFSTLVGGILEKKLGHVG